MDEIITDEFIQYKTGFLSGKNEIIEAFTLGKVMDFNRKDAYFLQEETWYYYGFLDGFTYFSDLIDEGKLDLEKLNTRKIVKECFTNRVMQENQRVDKEIPIGKFRM